MECNETNAPMESLLEMSCSMNENLSAYTNVNFMIFMIYIDCKV